MKIRAELYDADNKKTVVVKNLRWLLNLVSAYIKGGTELTIIVAGATIKARKL